MKDSLVKVRLGELAENKRKEGCKAEIEWAARQKNTNRVV